jgi:hypothetical protein
MNRVQFNGQVVIKKFRAVYIVRIDATHFSCSKKNIFRFFIGEKISNSLLVPQIQFCGSPGNEVLKAFAGKVPRDCRTDHSPMPGNVYF